MRKVFSIICLLFCVTSFAQKKVIFVSVNIDCKGVCEGASQIIADIFQERLIDDYDVRLTLGDNVYSKDKLKELKYQEMGFVPYGKIMDARDEVPAGYYCSIVISDKTERNEYIFTAKIWDLRTEVLEKVASYPNNNIPVSEIKSLRSIQIISLHLLDGLGFNVDDAYIEKIKDYYMSNKKGIDDKIEQEYNDSIDKVRARQDEIEREKKRERDLIREREREEAIRNFFVPEDGSAVYRMFSSGNSTGYFGLGFDFSKSWFKIGFDFSFGNCITDQFVKDDHKRLYDDDKELLKEKYLVTDEIYDEMGKISKREYALPLGQFTIPIGCMSRYFSFECGAGVYVSRNVNVEYVSGEDSDCTFTTKIKPYLALRPVVSFYIPIGEDWSISLFGGYNYIHKANVMSGWMLGIGFRDWNW